MKKIYQITLDKQVLPQAGDNLRYNIYGEKDAFFNLQVKDNSSPNKFYNFRSNTFTSTFTSENTLTNVQINDKVVDGIIKIPSASSDVEYRFLVFANSHLDTGVYGKENELLITEDITQKGPVTVRFSTSTDQTAAEAADKFEGIGAFTNSTSGGGDSSANTSIQVSEYSINDANSPSLGYKWSYDINAGLFNFLQESLQPIDSDFYTKVSTTTVGSGTDSTSMVLASVDNLVTGMSLVSIADSADLEQSGSLGVLTYPTIESIDTGTKTITLTAAPDWGSGKAVVFRAYGPDLIQKSTGGLFEFSSFKVFPTSSTGDRALNYSKIAVDGAVTNSTSIAVTGVSGLSAGSALVGSSISNVSNAHIISQVHSSGTPITMTGNQTLATKTSLTVYGSTSYAKIDGTITIKIFPSASTDIYFDIDRAFVIATTLIV